MSIIKQNVAMLQAVNFSSLLSRTTMRMEEGKLSQTLIAYVDPISGLIDAVDNKVRRTSDTTHMVCVIRCISDDMAHPKLSLLETPVHLRGPHGLSDQVKGGLEETFNQF